MSREPEFIQGVTDVYVPESKLSSEREAELREHFKQCELPHLTCGECKELYDNIGYQAYLKLYQDVEAEFGPTESEQYL